jgi:putative hydrolase of the HAD superfamily
MAQSIQAITFDFWRTLYYARTGSGERFDARVRIIAEATGLPAERVKPAFENVSREFLRVHITEQRTPHPRDAVPMLSELLDHQFDSRAARDLAGAIAGAFRLHPPEIIPGALEAVRAAADRVPVAIISDTSMSPGTEIRALLEREGFADYLRAFSFSDEIGVAKPQAAMFHHAANQLGVAPTALLHIGDLEPTDVGGALNVGARAGLFAGDNRRYMDGTRAEAVFEAWPEFVERLPRILG